MQTLRPILALSILSLGGFLFPSAASAESDAAAEQWDLTTLEKAPEFRWLDETSPVRSLLYKGLPFEGHDTEVFAYYANPATIAKNAEAPAPGAYPAVVLIHGGGGTAFAEWVNLWAKRGYAAIAMDLSGHRPPEPEYDENGELKTPDRGHKREGRTRLENGGPDQGRSEKFGCIDGDLTNDWPRHAVANAVLAHSLIRSFPEVDAERTAVTGISWGGYTTSLVASVDSRFKAAVPVYGCGFLFEGESVQKPSIDELEPEKRAEWIRRYDPSSHLGNCRVPILWGNGTHDIHYPLDSYQKSFDRVPGEKQIRIEPRMRHSHPAGWEPEEIGLFIDSKCMDGTPLPKPGEPVIDEEGNVRVEVESSVPLKEAGLHFTTADGLRSKREWEKSEAKIEGNTIIAPAPPAEANTWFLTITDERGAMVSTTVQLDEKSN